MIIDDSSFPIVTAWEGTLVHSGFVPAARGDDLPPVSLAKPTWWDEPQVLGEKWVPPAGGQRYGLARFAFSLRPKENQLVSRAELVVEIFTSPNAPAPVFFDLWPNALTTDKTGEFTVSVGPDIKFYGIEASIAKAETKINLKETVPVLNADGIGDKTARWIFAAKSSWPIANSQKVFAIVEMPPQCGPVYTALHLSVQIKTKAGPFTAVLPAIEEELDKPWQLC